ncbi:hypothetical protein [Sphingomonas sp. Leaf25]|uniref:hypothetical protein n=1 Tax=Sphingomonas sp. Leaf25 TaxID=1735692 RepID=UPI0007017BE2|nr:hypothetical protein [Sphingomonas sp. Leaf25]KQN07633.1 hypothetical protein ASE78_00415 [Sphingomonas sp. Leaf25]
MATLQAVTGGTETPDIPHSLFVMPHGMAIRYDQPADALTDYVTGYHLYAADGPQAMGLENWFLPGTATVRVLLNAGPVAVTIGRRRYDPLPQTSLFGPTSHAIHTRSNGGIAIGFGVSALGWARFFAGSAERTREQAVPLADAAAPGFDRRLLAVLSAIPDEHAMKPALDAFLIAEMGPKSPDEELIRRIAHLITDDTPGGVAEAARSWGVSQDVVRRTCKRYFGFGPKTLLIRSRFLRSLIPLIEAEGEQDYSRIDAAYVSASHFLRDAQAVLGTTPRRFVQEDLLFLTASLRARAAVLGYPTQALHRI